MKLWTCLLQLALTTKSHQPGEQHQSFCLIRNVEIPLGTTDLLLDSMSVFLLHSHALPQEVDRQAS